MMIHRRGIRKIHGDTSKLYEQIAMEEEVQEKTRINDEKRQKEIEVFIDRFRAKARLAGLVQSRIKTLQKRVRFEKLEKVETMEFTFNEAPIRAKYIMDIRNLHFSYDTVQPPIIQGISLAVAKNDRIGIVGKNGKGKSTFLKLLAGTLHPTRGLIKTHPGIQIGYFGQDSPDILNGDLRVEEELVSVNSGLGRKEVMDVCGSMLFGGELSQKKIGVLSGGERSRVLFGRLLLTPVNLLLLDEPTNHLDMESCDSLLSAIDRFDGALLMATHNEMFLHTLATRLVVFDGDAPFLFEGSYQDFLQRKGWEGEVGSDEQTGGKGGEKSARKEIRARRAEIVGKRSLMLGPVEKLIAEKEHEIGQVEAKMERNNRGIIDASSAKDGVRIQELSKESHLLRRRISVLYEELEGLLDEHERQSARYDAMLRELEG
jgi:ATP-binding cassette subfamily F protein 3